jgi:hypothetical protein
MNTTESQMFVVDNPPELLSVPGAVPSVSAGQLHLGTLVGFDVGGTPLVDFAGNEDTPQPLPARSTVALQPEQTGCEVVLAFTASDKRRPIILGCLVPPSSRSPEAAKPVEVKLDGQQLVFTADHEIVLRCGKASITLTRAGKVLIRGAYLLSRSSGVNRIKGGSVQIN